MNIYVNASLRVCCVILIMNMYFVVLVVSTSLMMDNTTFMNSIVFLIFAYVTIQCWNVVRPRTCIVLRGWTYGLSNKNLEEMCKNTQELVRQTNPDYIVWDGDLYQHDSFTWMVDHLIKKNPCRKFIAFKKDTSTHKLLSDYKATRYGQEMTGFQTTETTICYALNTKRASLMRPWTPPTTAHLTVIGCSKDTLSDETFTDEHTDKECEDWVKLSFAGLRLLRREMNVTRAYYITIGEGKVVNDEITRLTNANTGAYPDHTFLRRFRVSRTVTNKETGHTETQWAPYNPKCTS